MIALLLATLAHAADPNLTCLTPAEVETRILQPLHHLDRCQREVEILADERDGMHSALFKTSAALNDERHAREAAERKTKRARRGQAKAAGGGAAVGALLVLLLVLL